MAIARFVAQFAACLAVAAAIFASADLDAALPQDDVCEMSGGHECAISLRQLRAGGAPVLAVSEDGAFDAGPQLREEDTSTGLPAGEPDYEAQVDEPIATLHDDLGLAGSCAEYGCYTPFDGDFRCHCNDACHQHGNCCGDFDAQCSSVATSSVNETQGFFPGVVKTVYHTTSWDAGQSILNHGFRIGVQGWCGGGIYFAESPDATKGKAIGPDSKQGFMIEAQVAVGRVKLMPSTCNRSMSGPELWATGFDSISFNPGDGEETVVYSVDRVLSAKAYR